MILRNFTVNHVTRTIVSNGGKGGFELGAFQTHSKSYFSPHDFHKNLFNDNKFIIASAKCFMLHYLKVYHCTNANTCTSDSLSISMVTHGSRSSCVDPKRQWCLITAARFSPILFKSGSFISACQFPKQFLSGSLVPDQNCIIVNSASEMEMVLPNPSLALYPNSCLSRTTDTYQVSFSGGWEIQDITAH